MRIFIFVLILFSVQNPCVFAQIEFSEAATTCGGLRCITSNGIDVLFATPSNNMDTAYITNVDSM